MKLIKIILFPVIVIVLIAMQIIAWIIEAAQDTYGDNFSCSGMAEYKKTK